MQIVDTVEGHIEDLELLKAGERASVHFCQMISVQMQLCEHRILRENPIGQHAYGVVGENSVGESRQAVKTRTIEVALRDVELLQIFVLQSLVSVE